MSKATGTLIVRTPKGKEVFAWNGDVDDRNKAKGAFNEMMNAHSLAVVFDAPGKGHSVQTFEEVEQVEAERGTVVVQVTPALQGG